MNGFEDIPTTSQLFGCFFLLMISILKPHWSSNPCRPQEVGIGFLVRKSWACRRERDLARLSSGEVWGAGKCTHWYMTWHGMALHYTMSYHAMPYHAIPYHYTMLCFIALHGVILHYIYLHITSTFTFRFTITSMKSGGVLSPGSLSGMLYKFSPWGSALRHHQRNHNFHIGSKMHKVYIYI